MESKYFNEEGDAVAISKEGKKVIRDFKKRNFELYTLLNLYILTNFFEILNQELDEKDYNRIKQSIEKGI